MIRHRVSDQGDRRSNVERSLQVLVETAIGASKHLLPKCHCQPSLEARATIERVAELLSLDNDVLSSMRGALGMRHAIVHDYMNMNWQKIEAVLLENTIKSCRNT